MVNKKRREIIRLGFCSSIYISGCLKKVNVGGKLPCEPNRRIVIKLKEVTLPTNKKSIISPIKYRLIKSNEKDIIKKLLKSKEYKKCFPGPDELESFIKRAEEHKREQNRKYDAKDRPQILKTVFLKYQDQYYSLEIDVEDGELSSEYMNEADK